MLAYTATKVHLTQTAADKGSVPRKAATNMRIALTFPLIVEDLAGTSRRLLLMEGFARAATDKRNLNNVRVTDGHLAQTVADGRFAWPAADKRN